MSDLIERLRVRIALDMRGTADAGICDEAADEIVRLTKHVEQYYMALFEAEAKLAAVELENEELRQQLAECQTMRGACVLVPQAELEVMKKDAARYRWLREGGVLQWFDSTSNVSLDNLDAAIDQAMKGE